MRISSWLKGLFTVAATAALPFSAVAEKNNTNSPNTSIEIVADEAEKDLETPQETFAATGTIIDVARDRETSELFAKFIIASLSQTGGDDDIALLGPTTSEQRAAIKAQRTPD